MKSVVVAFSAGVDSTFLLRVACDTLGENVLAVTAVSATYPGEELIEAKRIARAFGVKHLILRTREIENKNFTANPANRCYFCKKELFEKLIRIKSHHHLSAVIDASSLSDKDDIRPGEQAKRELGIRSPLQEADFTKPDIRRMSRSLRLPTWDKPALACLASRVPYGTIITPRILKRIEQAEGALKKMGFRQVRVRHYGATCRIETEVKDIPRLLKRRKEIIAKFKNLGYCYITVDLEGYRTGSLNYAHKSTGVLAQ